MNDFEQIAFEHAKQFEHWRGQAIVHTGQPSRSRVYFRWVPVVDTRKPIGPESIVRIINQITIVNYPTRVVMRYEPELTAESFTALVSSLKDRLDGREIDGEDFAWGVSKLAESFNCYPGVTSTE